MIITAALAFGKQTLKIKDYANALLARGATCGHNEGTAFFWTEHKKIRKHRRALTCNSVLAHGAIKLKMPHPLNVSVAAS